MGETWPRAGVGAWGHPGGSPWAGTALRAQVSGGLMCGGRRTGTWLLTSALWPSWVPDLELISSEGRAGQAAGWFVQKSCLTPQPGSTPRKELCLLHLCALSPGCAPQAWPAGNFHGCQARAYRPGAPLLSAGTGKRWGPALNTFGVTALRSHGSGFPRGRSPFPANLSLWPQHHLLEIPQHDTRVAGNVFRRDCPRRGFWNWRVHLGLGGPWGKDWHRAT